MTSFWQNKKVLITGGASGIGKLMTLELIQKGARLLVWDVNANGLMALVAECNAGERLKTVVVDLLNAQEIETQAQLEIDTSGGIDVLINNAGIVVGGLFHEQKTSAVISTMRINSEAPMLLTHHFLKGMVSRKSGHVCTIASSAGLISNPGMAVYAGSKWAVTGWSDSLRLEMRQLNCNVGVTTVTPYYINTGMFDGVYSLIPLLDPNKVAKKIIRGIEKNKAFVSMPWSVRFVRFFQGLLPLWFFDWFVGKVLGIYKGMSHFKGRTN